MIAGTRVSVKYNDGKFYQGVVSKWDEQKGRAVVDFDDNTTEQLLLGPPGGKPRKGVLTHGADWRYVRGGKAAKASKPKRAGKAQAIQPAKAREVELLPPGDTPTDEFGLSNNQINTLRELYYGRGHYVGHGKLWHLLQSKHPDHDIRNRQMRAWLAAQVPNQLLRIPKKPRKTRPLVTPPEPCRVWQVDTLDLNQYKWARDYLRGPAYEGVDDQTKVYRYVYVIIDAYTRRMWAHMTPVRAAGDDSGAAWQGAVKAFQRAFKDAQSVFKYRPGLPDDVNVFGRNRRLIRPLLCTLDGGGEFGAEFQQRVKQLDPAIRTRTNAPNQPDLNSYVERAIGSLRQHLRQSIEAELGDIENRSVQRSLDWPERVRRAETAYNEEYHRNIKQSPNQLIKAWFSRPDDEEEAAEAQKQRDKAVERTSESELRKRHKPVDELNKLPVGARVRTVRRDLQKAELAGNRRKMQRRWSREIYTVSKRITPTIQQLGYPSMYILEEQPGVRWSREELQQVPEKRTIIPRQQQSGMGPVPPDTLRELKKAVREDTEHLSPDVRRRVRTRATGALGAYWRQGIDADVAAARVLRELRAAMGKRPVDIPDDALAVQGPGGDVEIG